MVNGDADPLTSSEDIEEEEEQEKPEPWRSGTHVVQLLPGTLFGEVALLRDQPRNATVVCAQDCDVLTIGRSDFNSILKKSMKKKDVEKLNFIRHHVPGMRHMEERRIEDYAYLFAPLKYAKGHCFIRQGGTSEGVLYFLTKGSVEFRMDSLKGIPVFSGLPEVGNRRLGCLAGPPGGMFGSIYSDRYEPFSIVVTTPQCDVYRLARDDMRRLPELVLRGLRDVLDNQNTWRVGRCDSPAGSILGTVPATLPSLQKGRRAPARKMLPVDLREEAAKIDSQQWDMSAGELIAMKGRRPCRLPPCHSSLGLSKSLPVLGSIESRPSSTCTSRCVSRPPSSYSIISRPVTTFAGSMYGTL